MLVATRASMVTVSAVEGSSVRPLPCRLCHSLHWDVYAFLGFLRGTRISR